MNVRPRSVEQAPLSGKRSGIHSPCGGFRSVAGKPVPTLQQRGFVASGPRLTCILASTQRHIERHHHRESKHPSKRRQVGVATAL